MPINMSSLTPPPSSATPPKRGPGRPRKVATPAAPSQPLFEKRTEGLLGLGQLFQAGLTLAKLLPDAAAVGMYAPAIAPELARLADTQPVAAKYVDLLIQVGPYAALVTPILGLGLQIAVNHKAIPAGIGGTVPPELLQARMEAEILRAETVAMRERQAAMEEAQTARDEYASMLQHNVQNSQWDPNLHGNTSGPESSGTNGHQVLSEV